jgi:ABC-type branched-subunit amino acid transport system substrate-binding protein
MRNRTRISALFVLITLLGTACAGGVGRRTSAAPAGADPISETATNAPAQGPAPATEGPSTTNHSSGSAPSSRPVPAVGRSGVAPSPTTSAAAAGTNAGAAPRPDAGPAVAPGPGSRSSTGAPAPATAAAVPQAGTRIGVTAQSLTLGVVYPKTGAYAGLFRNVPVVAQAAFDEAGPINGRRLVLKTYDDGTADPSTIQTEAKRAKDESFALLSAVSEANVVLAPLAERHGVPLIVGNIDEKVALPLSHVFAVLPYWARQARILPGFIQNVLGGGAKRIGVVYEGSSTAIDAKDSFKTSAQALGQHVVFEQPIARDQSTCANEVANLQAHGVELVVMMNGPLGAICMLRDARALGYRPAWTGVGVSWEANVVATASGGGADGIRKLAGMALLDSPAGRHFSEVMRHYAPNSGAADEDVSLLYYGLLRTFLEGLRRAGPDLTREGLVHTFETAMNGYDSGYLPPPTFGPGNRSGPLAVGVVACCTGGRWATVGTGWRETF